MKLLERAKLRNGDKPRLTDNEDLIAKTKIIIDKMLMELYLENNNKNTRFILSGELFRGLKRIHKLNDFIIICNDSNNTPEVIEECELRVDVTIVLPDGSVLYTIKRKMSSMGCSDYG